MRFLTYVSLPWPEGKQPYLELNLFVGLVGAGVVLMPFFLIAFAFKIGNLANDGYKLGYQLSACAMDPPSVLARSSGVIRNTWHHGGPTAPFIHLVAAFCFLMPKIFMGGRLIDVGFLANCEYCVGIIIVLYQNKDKDENILLKYRIFDIFRQNYICQKMSIIQLSFIFLQSGTSRIAFLHLFVF